MMKKLENHLRYAKFAPFRNLDKPKPSKGPYIRYQNRELSLPINIHKNFSIFLYQKFKIKGAIYKRQPYFKSATISGDWLIKVV